MSSEAAPALLRPARQPLPWDEYLLRGLFGGELVLVVLVPLLALSALSLNGGVTGFVRAIVAPTALRALRLTLWTSLCAATINALLGTMLAWVLTRYRFFGRGLLAKVIDLPFSLPTLVAGVMIVALLGPQSWLGSVLTAAGMPIAYAAPGILIALLFVTLPIVVRAVEPVLLALDPAEEEAAAMLGASRLHTFRRVIFPSIRGAVLTGSIQTLARALAEFGAIVVVSGNIAGRTLTAPVYIYGEVEGGELGAASAVSTLLLLLAVVLLLLRKSLDTRVRRV